MTLTTRQVTAHYQHANGSPASGYVTFTPTAPLASASDDAIVWPAAVYTTLSATGDLTATLLTTDASGPLPTGWVYRVTEAVTGATRDPWLAAIPAGGSPLNLADISPLEELPDLVQYDPAGTAAAAVAAHEADTTAVHGIASTALLETTAGATAKVTAHSGATDPHGDRAFATTAANTAGASALAAAQAYADALGATLLARAANLSDLQSAATARTNLGLGTAATRNIGTSAGTAAAGDDARLTDARTPLTHALSHATGNTDPIAPSDIGAAPTSRQIIAGTGLTGGGNLTADRTLTVTYGTGSGTAAQGNDARIVGALQAASNLSDVPTPATARTNLGLGNSATRAVGTTAGTVAAGDDARITGAAPKPRIVPVRITTGDITFSNTSDSWATLLDTGGNRLEVSVAAAAGDWVELAFSGMMEPAATSFLDLAVLVGSSRVRYLSSGTATPSAEGDPSLYPQAGAYRTFGFGAKGFVAAGGDLDSGSVRFAVAFKTVSVAGKLFASTAFPLWLCAKNLGPPAP